MSFRDSRDAIPLFFDCPDRAAPSSGLRRLGPCRPRALSTSPASMPRSGAFSWAQLWSCILRRLRQPSPSISASSNASLDSSTLRED